MKNNRKTVWTPEMDARLIELWGVVPMGCISSDLGLSYCRIHRRANSLGLKKRPLEKLHEIDRDEWRRIATKRAKKYGVAPRDVIEGYTGSKACIMARWEAYREVLDTYPHVSIIGLARVSGFDHTGILHALRKLKGLSTRKERSSGRRPYLQGVIAIPVKQEDIADRA